MINNNSYSINKLSIYLYRTTLESQPDLVNNGYNNGYINVPTKNNENFKRKNVKSDIH